MKGHRRTKDDRYARKRDEKDLKPRRSPKQEAVSKFFSVFVFGLTRATQNRINHSFTYLLFSLARPSS
jgi:hypothetical protein